MGCACMPIRCAAHGHACQLVTSWQQKAAAASWALIGTATGTSMLFENLRFGYPSVTHQNLRNNSTLHLCHDCVDHGRCKSLGCWSAPWTCPSFLGQPVRMTCTLCRTQITSRSRSHHIQGNTVRQKRCCWLQTSLAMHFLHSPH